MTTIETRNRLNQNKQGAVCRNGTLKRLRTASSDTKAYSACFGLAVLFGGLFINDTVRQQAKEAKELASQIVTNFSVSSLLDGRNSFQGSSAAPYTLVEFGDYECPPCRARQVALKEVMKRYDGKIRLDFRQFPLTKIHPHAQSAAVAAESARISGDFWSTHEKLFSADLSQKQATNPVGVTLLPEAAAHQMRKDAALAKQLGVNSTPSFILVTPDKKVYRLPNLEAIDKLVH